MAKVVRAGDGALIAKVEVAETMFARMRGLLGRAGLPAKEGMLIEHCSSIHTLFMKFPLDVIFVDAGFTVRKLVRRLQPWRMAMALGAAHVIELNAGALDAVSVKAGDVLKIEDVA